MSKNLERVRARKEKEWEWDRDAPKANTNKKCDPPQMAMEAIGPKRARLAKKGKGTRLNR